MPSKSRIHDLLRSYMSRELSHDETEELRLLMADGLNKDLVNEVLAEMIQHASPDREYEQERFDPLFNKVIGIDRVNQPVSGGSSKPVARLGWLRYAAASIVILIAGAYFLVSNYRQTTPKAVQNTEVAGDLPPGSNKAILSLSNGRNIELVSSKDTLTDVNVDIKNANGELIYSRSSADLLPGAVAAFNTVTTPRGGQYKLSLPDGTRVWLNASSSITFPTLFAGADRSVSITGEAYFEVAHNPAKSFHVHVNGMEVVVLGTHFNINSYSDEAMIKTTLLEGSVRVNLRTKKNNSLLQSTILKPGEQAQIAGSGAAGIEVDAAADIEQVVAWKNGITSFKNADIRAIMRQVSRWYDVSIVYEGSPPLSTFTGEVSRQANVSKVLELFEFAGIHCRVEEKRIVVTP